jgi:hypothetical protein
MKHKVSVMNDLSRLTKFFNDISLTDLENLAGLKLQDISSMMKFLEQIFEENIKELRHLSVNDITATNMLSSTNAAQLVMDAIIDDSSLNTWTDYINHWIAKIILCQKSINMLIIYLMRKCEHYKLHWKEYIESDKLDTFTNKRRYHTVLKTYSIIGGLCQNIGLAISDYFRLHSLIESNISLQDKDFTRPLIADPEITVSERLSRLTQELENCLLANPSESILGFAAVRMTLESYIRIKIQDKMRQNIRIRNGNNNLDVKFTSKLQPRDIRKIFGQLFSDENEYKALEKIYSISSMTVHRTIPIANYLNWGSLTFVLDSLEKKINGLDPEDKKLENIISKLESDGKLLIAPSKWYK